MDVMPMTGGLGAEIFGADVRDSAQFPEIYEAFAKYSVIPLNLFFKKVFLEIGPLINLLEISFLIRLI